jgi:hypothetical protein
MSVQKRSEALRDALQFLVSSSIPSQYKGLLLELVGQAMRDDDVAQRTLAADAAGSAWQPEEIECVRNLLEGRIARSWQQADELLMRVAMQLGRKLGDVRSKAMELNLGAGVDFRLAKTLQHSEAKP